MRPLHRKTFDKSQAFIESLLFISPGTGVIHYTTLQIDRRDDSNAMTQERVSGFETLSIEHVDEVDYPGCMWRDQIRSVLQENLWNDTFRIA